MAENDFLNYYLQRGFGSMTKKDVELWVFYQLLAQEDKSDYEFSRELKITETRVKNLRYEAQLVYGENDDKKLEEQLKQLFTKAKCRDGAIEGKIILSISNKMLRQYLADILEKDNRIYDSSFNSAIVSLSASDYFWVLQELFLDKKQKEEIIKFAKKNLAEGSAIPTTISEVLVSTGVGLGKTILEKFVGDYATDKIVKTITDLINKQ